MAMAIAPATARSQGRSGVDTTGTALTTRALPGVEVIGSVQRLERIPGSAVRIDATQLRESRVFNTNELLRNVTGLNVRE